MDCQAPTPTSQYLSFLVNKSIDIEIVYINLSRIDELICTCCISSSMKTLVILAIVIPKIWICWSNSRLWATRCMLLCQPKKARKNFVCEKKNRLCTPHWICGALPSRCILILYSSHRKFMNKLSTAVVRKWTCLAGVLLIADDDQGNIERKTRWETRASRPRGMRFDKLSTYPVLVSSSRQIEVSSSTPRPLCQVWRGGNICTEFFAPARENRKKIK